MLHAFLVRAVVLLVLDYTGYGIRLAPDEGTFDDLGWYLSLYWSGVVFAPPAKMLTGGISAAYLNINAFFFFIFGHTGIPVKLTNAFLGVFAGRYVYLLARALLGKVAALRATTLFIFFPSLVLWSSLNIRDAWVIFLILFISWKAWLLLDTYTLGRLLQLVTGLFLLTQFRDHLFYAVAAPPVIALLIGRRGSLARNLLLAFVVSVGVLMLLQHGVIEDRTQSRMSLEAINQMRHQASGASAFAQEADISTPVGAVTFLPLGLAYFFFSPFPWQITSFLKLISVPEMLLVYYLVMPTVRGLRYIIRNRLREALQILMVTGLLTLTYALGEGNVGTLYRHRAQAMPFYLIFASAGLEMAEEAKKRRAEARAPYLRPART
jgi:4-amino-4-deoxy-L-arabinose transferase-like glycosyltransferase